LAVSSELTTQVRLRDLFPLLLTSYILHFESSRNVYPQFQAKFAQNVPFS